MCAHHYRFNYHDIGLLVEMPQWVEHQFPKLRLSVFILLSSVSKKTNITVLFETFACCASVLLQFSKVVFTRINNYFAVEMCIQCVSRIAKKKIKDLKTKYLAQE
jgi:hypothetical protein